MPNLIGTAPNQVPTNGSLGNMAFQNKEAVSVDTLVTTGNVGLGVSPSAWGSGFKAFEFGNSATQTGALFSNNTNDTWFVSNAYFNGSNFIYKSSGYATAVEQIFGAHKWYTAPSGTAGNAISFTQAMTLDGSGNLMLGVTSSGAAFTIARSTFADISLRGGSNTASAEFVVSQANDSVAYVWNRANAATAFGTNNTERMRILSTGNVGINDTAPAERLSVIGNIRFQTTVSTAVGSLSSTASTVDLDAAGANSIRFNTNSTERARIDSSGNLLVGSGLSATARLVVASTTSTGEMRIQGSGTNSFYGSLYKDNGTGEFRITQADGGVGMTFYTGSSPSERMRIDSSGNVGIGTSSPGAKLAVASGNVNLTDLYALNWGVQSTYIYGSSSAGNIKLATNNTDRVTVDASGNVGIGTSSPSALLDVNADTVRVRTAKTPASATATGNAGDICWDSNYIYVCVATNTWKRSALSTW